MRYLKTNEYRAYHLALIEKQREINADIVALRTLLFKKLQLLVRKFPETRVHSMQYDKPRPEHYFDARQLTKKPRRWNPNFLYAANNCPDTLLFYIEQIETANNV